MSVKSAAGILDPPIKRKLSTEYGFYNFIAEQGDQTRIYSFWKSKTGYVIAQTGNDITFYQDHILDSHILHSDFKLKSITKGEVIKEKEQKMDIFIDKSLKPDEQIFSTAIDKLGNDETTAETVMGYLIPFYSCISYIKKNDLIGSIATCPVDISGLI